MEKNQTLKSEYFDQVYAANDDPWNFETSDYEAAKYDATIKALPRNNYKNALEIGCSIGVLTKLLAAKCTNLLAIDVSQQALDQAAERCKSLKNVSLKKMNFADESFADNFDLIVVSEVAYYLSPGDWEAAALRLFNILEEKGQIILIHWLPIVHDYPQTGDEVHRLFSDLMTAKMKPVFNAREENYRIDIWEKL